LERIFWAPFAASIFAALITTLGIGAIRHFEPWAIRNSPYFACFAARVLISISFLHIIPTSLRLSSNAPVFLLGGYLFIHLLNRFLTAYVCDRPATRNYAIGLVPLIGIGIYSFIDSVIYSVTFSVSALTGALAALGMILHEFPEGIFTYVLLLRGGFADRPASVASLFAAALTTPTGMLVSYPIVSQIDDSVLAAVLATSAGALIYVGASHLLPAAEREYRRYSHLVLAAGGALAAGIVVTHA